MRSTSLFLLLSATISHLSFAYLPYSSLSARSLSTSDLLLELERRGNTGSTPKIGHYPAGTSAELDKPGRTPQLNPAPYNNPIPHKNPSTDSLVANAGSDAGHGAPAGEPAKKEEPKPQPRPQPKPKSTLVVANQKRAIDEYMASLLAARSLYDEEDGFGGVYVRDFDLEE